MAEWLKTITAYWNPVKLFSKKKEVLYMQQHGWILKELCRVKKILKVYVP